MVEGLRSYAGRVSAEHNVTVRELIRHLVKDTSWEQRSKIIYTAHQGHSDSALIFAQLLAAATEQELVKLLILRTVGGFFCSETPVPDQRGRKFCPLCYQEMRKTTGVVYDPLLWGISEVHVCPWHKLYLQVG